MKKMIAVLTIVLTLLCSTVFSSATENPNVVLVNPAANSVVYSSNLLISVKLTQPITIRVIVYEDKTLNDSSFTPVLVKAFPAFSSNNNLSFYTQQVNGLKPGLYKIQVDTLDAAYRPVHTNSSQVIIREKTEADTKILDTPQSGTMQFLQNLLKTIFGS